jgi:hypothetical protein
MYGVCAFTAAKLLPQTKDAIHCLGPVGATRIVAVAIGRAHKLRMRLHRSLQLVQERTHQDVRARTHLPQQRQLGRHLRPAPLSPSQPTALSHRDPLAMSTYVQCGGRLQGVGE